MVHITVVSPVYNSRNIIPHLVKRLEKVVSNLTENYEIILIDDFSLDGSWNVMENLAEENTNLKVIKLSRNFGQHYAITAGLDIAKGEWVVVMDCDLQDRPEEILNLYKKATQEDYDIVLASRFNRKDPFFKKLYSKYFYKALGFLTGSEHDSSVANFGIYRKNVIKEIISLRESIRYFPTMVNWVGFKKSTIIVEHSERLDGKSSYNFKKMFNLAIDIILAYSDKPIKIAIKLGIIISLISFVMSFYTFIKWYNGTINVVGYSSLIISIWLLSGFILTTLGIVGLYVGKTFEGVKGRPIYIIEKTKNV